MANKPLNFAMIGVGGYIASKHLQAIRDTGNNLTAALDPKDSVGILDRYFDDVDFFTEFERFDRHLEKLKRQGDKKIDYITICSPNYLHDSHIRFALRMGANVICEKPLVINPWNLDAIQELEKETGKNVNTILQLRVHPVLLALKKQVEDELTKNPDKKFDIEMTYITPRGKWYFISWKGDEMKSGGLVMNIGIHLFDMLIWMFGKPSSIEVHYKDQKKASGYLELKNARVKWFLSLDKADLPKESTTTCRSIKVDGKDINFTEGFTDLHTTVYKITLEGNGFGIEDAKPSITLVHDINTSKITHPKEGKAHSYISRSMAEKHTTEKLVTEKTAKVKE